MLLRDSHAPISGSVTMTVKQTLKSWRTYNQRLLENITATEVSSSRLQRNPLVQNWAGRRSQRLREQSQHRQPRHRAPKPLARLSQPVPPKRKGQLEGSWSAAVRPRGGTAAQQSSAARPASRPRLQRWLRKRQRKTRVKIEKCVA